MFDEGDSHVSIPAWTENHHTVRLFSVCRLLSAKVTPEQMSENSVFHYSIPNVQTVGTGVEEDGSSIASDKLLISEPCVLISKLNPRKSTVCLASPQSMLSVASTEFVSITTGDDTDNRYLFWVLRSSIITQYLSSIVSSTTNSHQRVQPSDVYGMDIPWPAKETRTAIYQYLDRETAEIDAMLAKLNSLSEALAERKVLVIQNLTQRSDSGVRWTAVPTAHLFSSIGSGTTPKGMHYYAESGSGIPWVTTSELRESVIVETIQDVTEEAVGALSALRVHPRGSVVIAMYGATIGRLAMLGVDATMNQACCAFSSPRNVDSRFFYYALWGQREELILEANGGGQPNISQGFLRRWRVPCPPLVEQRRIADYLDEVTGRIDAMLTKIDELKALLVERRATLITDVITGRKKVA